VFSIHKVILMTLDDLDLFIQGHVKIFASYTVEKRTSAGATFKMTHEVEPGRVWKCGKIQLFLKDEQVHFIGEISSIAQPDERQHFQLIVGSILDDLREKGVIVMDAQKAQTKDAAAKSVSTLGVAGEIEIVNRRKPPKPPTRWGTSEASFYNDAEGETITVHMVTGETLSGELIGLDTYNIVILPDSGKRVLLSKHAIAYAHVENAQP
jgi:sRNA-binding regulator protein Hfq